MSSNESTSIGGIALAVLGGAALGATLALLFAPQSGRKTRQKIRELGQDVEEGARDLYDRAGKAAEEAMEKSGEWLRDSQDFVGDLKRKASSSSDGARSGR